MTQEWAEVAQPAGPGWSPLGHLVGRVITRSLSGLQVGWRGAAWEGLGAQGWLWLDKPQSLPGPGRVLSDPGEAARPGLQFQEGLEWASRAKGEGL